MPPSRVRVLFTADTHLGIDMPSRPRVERRRRGEDFFENFERVIAPVFAGEIDVFLHGGDLFFRSKIPAWLADLVFQRLADIADTGTPVFIVPGNHERSAMPRSLFLTHPNIHVFDAPRTFVSEHRGVRVALSGFPYSPTIRGEFPTLLASTGYLGTPAEVRILCLHQLIEGAKVGPANHTFTSGDDVLPASVIPAGFAAVLSGHVHRFQMLDRALSGTPLPAPVFYCGSIERTSFAERLEPKGSLLLEFGGHEDPGGKLLAWDFRELPARPMVELALDPRGLSALELEKRLRGMLDQVPPGSIVRIRLVSDPSPETLDVLRAERLRSLVPKQMSISVAWKGVGFRRRESLPHVSARVPTGR